MEVLDADRPMSARAQLDAEVGERRAKGAKLVFLNIPKLDSLKARPREHRTEFWDRALRGFGVRVYSSGRKIFTVRYTVHGEQRRKDLGVYRNERGIVGGPGRRLETTANSSLWR
jgi:hypothetical protein